MVPIDVLVEVERFLREAEIARFEGDRIVMTDGSVPLRMFVPPPSLQTSGSVWSGLEYLRTQKPPVALLLSIHSDGSDFDRLVEHNGHLLERCRIVGVEAYGDKDIVSQIAVPRPKLSTYNHWLAAFQEVQFSWMEQRGIHMLPCEPVWEGELDERLKKLDTLYNLLKQGDVKGYSPEAQRVILHPLSVYCRIFRTWGLIGQFGYWQSQPAVRNLLAGSEGPSPIILGVAHTPERYVLQYYCQLAFTVHLIDRTNDGSDIESEGFWWVVEQGTVRQGMPLSDLNFLFPL